MTQHNDDPTARMSPSVAIHEAELRIAVSGPTVVTPTIWGDPGTCRFCGLSAPAVTFDKPAHLMPASLGNTHWFLADECDDCNQRGGRLEDDLAKMLIADRVMARIAPRKGVLTHEARANGSRIVSRPLDGELDISLALEVEDSGIELEPTRDGPLFLVRRQTFSPARAARALGRMALMLMTREELAAVPHLLQWVRSGQAVGWLPTAIHGSKLSETATHVQLRLARIDAPPASAFRVDFLFGATVLMLLLPAGPWHLPEFRDPAFSTLVIDGNDLRDFTPLGVAKLPGYAPPTDEEIEDRAYARWRARGCPPDDELDDWFEAERELWTERQSSILAQHVATNGGLLRARVDPRRRIT